MRTIELEELQAKHLGLREKRIELYGNILNQLWVELGKRALDQVSTEKILLLIIKYSEALKGEALETVVTPRLHTARGLKEGIRKNSHRNVCAT